MPPRDQSQPPQVGSPQQLPSSGQPPQVSLPQQPVPSSPTYSQAYNQLAASAVPQPNYPGQQPGRIPAPQPSYGQAAQPQPNAANAYNYNPGQPRPTYSQPQQNMGNGGVVPPPPPRPVTPYDFFMANQAPEEKKGLLGKKGSGSPSKLVLIAVGGVGLVVLLGIVALFLPKGETKLELVAVAQSQNETLRICNEGGKEAKLQSTRSFVTNCSLSLISEQRTLLAVMSRSGVATDEATLSAGRNAKTDSQLASAKSASNYDETFVNVAEAQLAIYSRSIQAAAAAPTATETEKKVLSDQYTSAQLLLQQLKTPST